MSADAWWLVKALGLLIACIAVIAWFVWATREEWRHYKRGTAESPLPAQEGQ